MEKPKTCIQVQRHCHSHTQESYQNIKLEALKYTQRICKEIKKKVEKTTWYSTESVIPSVCCS